MLNQWLFALILGLSLDICVYGCINQSAMKCFVFSLLTFRGNLCLFSDLSMWPLTFVEAVSDVYLLICKNEHHSPMHLYNVNVIEVLDK